MHLFVTLLKQRELIIFDWFMVEDVKLVNGFCHAMTGMRRVLLAALRCVHVGKSFRFIDTPL